MLPWIAKPSPVMWPHQGVHSAPVKLAARPATSTRPNWRTELAASPATTAASASVAVSPARSRSSASMARYGLTQACVEAAPTPGTMRGQIAPTAGTAVVTATPSALVRGQRATMENVFNCIGCPLDR